MLSYMIKTTEALLMTAVLLGVAIGYTRSEQDRRCKTAVLIGVLAGTAASVVMSVLKNTTSLIDTGTWNLRNFTISLIAYVLFLLCCIMPLRKKLPRFSDMTRWIALAVILGLAIFYSMPDVWAYLYQDSLVKTTLVSTDYLYKIIGYVFGFVLNIVVFFAVYECTIRLSEKGQLILLSLEILLREIRQVTLMLSIMLAKRIITNNHTAFTIAKVASNHSNWFLYGAMLLVVVVSLLLWYRSFHVNEPYRNPAERRKIRAKWRHIRQWATTALIAFFLCVMNMTVVKAMSTTTVELSPVEPAEIGRAHV